jgi:hypothetical protein
LGARFDGRLYFDLTLLEHLPISWSYARAEE